MSCLKAQAFQIAYEGHFQVIFKLSTHIRTSDYTILSNGAVLMIKPLDPILDPSRPEI